MMKSKVLGIISVLFALGKFIECDIIPPIVPPRGPSLYCSDLNPQNNIDIDQVRFFYLQFFSSKSIHLLHT